MKYLNHTVLLSDQDGALIKYEIYTKQLRLENYGKVPEGTCRIVAYKLDDDADIFKVIDSDFSIDELFKANQPKPNTWYSDGPDRVNLDMVVEYLKKI
ncbi:TPA: hypothetical protein MYM54_003333 [Klebsiella pneumoniae]|uniref:hypothetical protein n=1 Tax=Klebsiella huaxiensis TaxID=2153354 RepID=UPI001159FF68|nr:hypothetical protein [Klebsiella huaxiensis]VUT16774.1 hypothetical protein SB6421_01570 [Klebsiella huaxiensis]HCB0413122.1 hypothetical protein [Klebsiella pneumoniae]